MHKRKIAPASAPMIDPSQLQLLDVPAVAKLLSIGKTSVYQLINQGQLPVVKIGGATRISLVAVQRYIAQNERVS